MREDIETAALEVIGQREHDRQQDSSTEARWYAAQSQTNEQLAASYAESIRSIQNEIVAKQTELQIDENQVLTDMNASIAVAHQHLEDDMHNAADADLKKLEMTALKLGFAALVASVYPPAGVSIGAAAIGGSVGSAVTWADDHTTKYKSHAAAMKDVWKQAGALVVGTAGYLWDEWHCDVDIQHLKVKVENCGVPECKHMDEAKCKADNAKITRAAQQLVNVQQMLESLDALAQFDHLLLTPDADITVADIPHVAMQQASLGSIDAGFAHELFANAVTAKDVAPDVEQLVSLLTSKLEMMGNFYRAKLAARNFEVRSDMLQSQANRASELSAGTNERGQMMTASWESQLTEKCYSALLILLQQMQAFEFAVLVDYPPREALLQQLTEKQLSSQQYHDLLTEHQESLAQSWRDELEGSNNCGGGTWSRVDFALDEISGNSFATDGRLTVNIDLPDEPGYSHVTFEDVEIFLLGLQPQDQPVGITFNKLGVSSFLDENGEIWTFTHEKTSPSFVTGYDAETCEETQHMVSAGDDGSNLCRFSEGGSVYMKYSPYGLWSLQVENAANIDLASVSAVRFAFHLNFQPLGPADADSNRMVFNSSTAMTKSDARQCVVDLCDGVSCGSHGWCDGDTGQCTCVPGYTGAHCHVFYGYDVCDTISCGAHGRCRADDETGTASCDCRHGWTGALCDEVSLGQGGALLGMDLNLSPVHAGLALAGVVGVAGVATLAKRRMAVPAPDLSVPLASAV